MNVDAAIARVRAFAADRRLSKGRLAKSAGLRDTVLRHFDRPDWNPTVETLRQIEAVIPADWSPTQHGGDRAAPAAVAAP